MREAGWTPEEQRKRDSFVLLVGNARLPNSPKSRLQFMEQARWGPNTAVEARSCGPCISALVYRLQPLPALTVSA